MAEKHLHSGWLSYKSDKDVEFREAADGLHFRVLIPDDPGYKYCRILWRTVRAALRRKDRPE